MPRLCWTPRAIRGSQILGAVRKYLVPDEAYAGQSKVFVFRLHSKCDRRKEEAMSELAGALSPVNSQWITLGLNTNLTLISK